jgi:alkanesulfonate monooxygenase SsuD/methylene tetrahydromethanopterin reductase-like flavin-dependent oxidoreductase (luciferase family)
VDFEGEYFAAHLDGLSETKRRIHMIIGGRAPFIVRQTAAFGDEWNFFAPIPENFDVLKAGLEASGREIGISQMGPFIVAENASQLRARVGREMRRRGIAGDEEVQVEALRKRGWLVGITDDFRETVNRLRERGVEKFYFQALETSDRDHVELLASILKEM